MNDPVVCHNYTPGRRHQKVLGRIGSTVLPFTVTIPQIVTIAVVVPIVLVTAPLWSLVVPAPLMVPTVTIAAAWAVRFARIEGRSPIWAAVGRMQLAMAPPGGVTAGRATRRVRPRHHTGALSVLTAEPDLVQADVDHATADDVDAVGSDAAVVAGVRWRCLDAA